MCTFFGQFQGVDIAFLEGNIYNEKNVIMVKNPVNASDENDKRIPERIPLKNIVLKKEDRDNIENRFLKKKKEKQQKKLRRPAYRQ